MQFEYSQASIYRQIRIKESNNEPQGPKTGRDDSRTSQMGIIKSSFRTVVFFFFYKTNSMMECAGRSSAYGPYI